METFETSMLMFRRIQGRKHITMLKFPLLFESVKLLGFSQEQNVLQEKLLLAENKDVCFYLHLTELIPVELSCVNKYIIHTP